MTLRGGGQHLADLPRCSVSYEWPLQKEPSQAGAPQRGRLLFAWSMEGGDRIPVEAHLRALQQASQEGDFGFDSQPYASTLRMVVLCACQSGDGGALASRLGGVAQALHRVGIEAVVASRLPLSSRGSVLLTETLYRKLLVDSCSLEESLAEARSRPARPGSCHEYPNRSPVPTFSPRWEDGGRRMRYPWGMAKAAYQVVRAIRNPERLEDILALAGVLAPPQALRRLTDSLWRIPPAAEALRQRPRMGTVDVPALRNLPPGTLGRAFADHLLDNGLDLNALPRLPARTDAEYVRAHLLEVHDVWHVLTGFGTRVDGELGLQAFSLAQLGSPFAAGILTGGLANTLLFAFQERDVRMRAIVRGWLLGKRARLLFGGAWARMWESPLEEVQAAFGLDLRGVEALLPAVAQSC